MTKTEFNQKVIEATDSLLDCYESAFNEMREKFEVAEKFIHKLEIFKLTHNIFQPYSYINIIYWMSEEDIYPPSRILWQIVEDIDEEAECFWNNALMDADDLKIYISGYTLVRRVPIQITVYFSKSKTCKVEYIEETVPIRRTKVTC